MFKNLKINFLFSANLAIIIFALIVVGLVILIMVNSALDKKIAMAEEEARAADITITILTDSSCDGCFNPNSLVKAIKKENVKVNLEKTIDINSSEGKELIAKFGIAKVPTMLVAGEIEKPAALKNLWNRLGDIKDNTFVLRQVGAPYIDLNSNQVRGMIKLVMLSDSSCVQCYNVSNHKAALRNLGILSPESETLDINLPDGQKLVNQYGIKMAPTIVLTGDIEAYPDLIAIWPQVGTVESDGAYVFRDGVKLMGAYRDLASNQVIEPENRQ